MWFKFSIVYIKGAQGNASPRDYFTAKKTSQKKGLNEHKARGGEAKKKANESLRSPLRNGRKEGQTGFYVFRVFSWDQRENKYFPTINANDPTTGLPNRRRIDSFFFSPLPKCPWFHGHEFMTLETGIISGSYDHNLSVWKGGIMTVSELKTETLHTQNVICTTAHHPEKKNNCGGAPAFKKYCHPSPSQRKKNCRLVL